MRNDHFGKRLYNFEDIIEARKHKKSVMGSGGMFGVWRNSKNMELPFAERVKISGLKPIPAAVIINMNANSVHNMLKSGLYIYITKKEIKENG